MKKIDIMLEKFRLRMGLYILAVVILFLLSPHAIACDSCKSTEEPVGPSISDEISSTVQSCTELEASRLSLDRPSRPIIEGPSVGEVNKLLPFEAVASNPDGKYISYVFEWWENGMLSESESTGYVPPDTPVTKYHAWHSTGANNYVRVKAIDRNGDESFWAYKYVKIYSIPQIPTIYAPSSACTRRTVMISAQTIDNYNDVRYQYDWGDGRTVTTGLFRSGQLNSQWVSWNIAKTYTVKVRAQNRQGMWSDWSAAKRVVVRNCK